ncbi:macrophage receptor MARCO isoform X1 [Bombina bombina]|uniref:macrophage receptor MARCO isoform X1 n=2 Tax=Bombina bombina TaxID=8345 RepID=UPI00235A74C6|nr:macrophage receptor MARCO isoform X1 [Bombina bombina]
MAHCENSQDKDILAESNGSFRMSEFEIDDKKPRGKFQIKNLLTFRTLYMLLLSGLTGYLTYKVITLQKEFLTFKEEVCQLQCLDKSDSSLGMALKREGSGWDPGSFREFLLQILNETILSSADLETERLFQLENEMKTIRNSINNITLIQGPPGLNGTKGQPGTPGNPGTNGVPGMKGQHGSPGNPGSKGEKGDRGNAGMNGEPGNKGEPGTPGNPGSKGEKGDTGPQGTKGDKGKEGLIGLKGSHGAPGVPGVNGSPGLNGLKGDTGAPGPEGQKGSSGSSGIQGLPGPSGPPGQKGDKGDIGISGKTGLQGIPGRQGEKGDKGDKGSIGNTGPKGDQGTPGLNGPPGEKGESGQTGLQGPKGDRGEKGSGSSQVVRIAGGGNRGRVEVKYNGEWGTICDDNWDMQDGKVICKMLGFSSVIETFTAGGGEGKILIDDAACTGNEESIYLCPKTDWGVHNCNHSEDAGVSCG